MWHLAEKIYDLEFERRASMKKLMLFAISGCMASLALVQGCSAVKERGEKDAGKTENVSYAEGAKDASDANDAGDGFWVDRLVNWAITHDEANLSEPIVHKVYHWEGSTDAKVVSVYNGDGDISISESKDNKMNVTVNLIQTKSLKDIDKKKDNLKIVPQHKNGIFYLEPLAADGTTNYWKWIQEKCNANGIQVEFQIQIPKSIQEVRIYDDLGNVSLSGITARIYAQTDIGTITGQNVTPLDTATFKSNMTSSGDGTVIHVSYANLDQTNEIIGEVSMGNILFSLPKGAKYTQEKKDDFKGIEAEDGMSQIDVIRKECLKDFPPIKGKQDGTLVVTGSKDSNSDITIN